MCSPFRKRQPLQEVRLGAAALRKARCSQACGSGVLAGSAAPGRLGPAAPHGGGQLLGRRPGLPHWSGFGFSPQSLVSPNAGLRPLTSSPDMAAARVGSARTGCQTGQPQGPAAARLLPIPLPPPH